MNINKDKIFKYTTLILYVIVTFIGITHHEEWRDEAQSWLLVRDQNIFELFNSMKMEGTPFLWHLIIMPFAKAGFPYFTQLVIHWLIAVSAVGVFIFKAPFTKITKFLFVFSYLICFEYVVKGRNYAITMLLLFLIASIYESRFERKILFATLIMLLANTNLFSLIPAAMLGIIFFYDLSKEKQLRAKTVLYSFALIAFGVAFSFVQVWGPFNPQVNHYIAPLQLPQMADAIKVFNISILNAFIHLDYEVSDLKVAFFFVLILIFTVLYFTRNFQVFAFIAVSLMWMMFIYIFKVHKYRHVGLMILLIIFSFWIMKSYMTYWRYSLKKYIDYEGLKAKIIFVLQITFFISLCYNANIYYKEFRYTYSGAKDVSEFIKKQNLTNIDIVTYPGYITSAVVPYLPKNKFWNAERLNYISFINWGDVPVGGDANTVLSFKDIYERVKNDSISKKNHLLLVCSPIDSAENYGYKLVFENDTIIDWQSTDERYYLYENLKKN